MRLPPLLVVFLIGAACGQPVVQYETTDDVRKALASEGIGCRDFAWDPPPTAIACSFAEWMPERGLKGGTVVIYANEAAAITTLERCQKDGHDGGQLLYRDGQRWLASIEAYASDRRTARDIEDQSFVTRVAELLGTDVIDC
jgi:hypothetical protein